MAKKNVVMIGGGTGTYKILSGLKKYKGLNLTAIVAVTDDGGSGGKLRDEFGFLPAGDLRQCIVALSEEGNGANILRDLFNYRFQKGGVGLEGHSFGNLFITAMSDLMEGDQEKAIQYVSKILRIKGQVIPVSLDDTSIAVEQADGTVITGESRIKDDYKKRNVESPIIRAWLKPKATATPRAIEAIKNADLIIIGPGGLYTSLIANLLVDGIKDALLNTKAKILFNMNLMTDAGQTHNISARKHLESIAKYIGRNPDFVLMNKKKFPKELVQIYKKSDDFPVKDDIENLEGVQILKENLISGKNDKIHQRKDFATKMSLIRHDSKKIAKVIVNKVLKKI